MNIIKTMMQPERIQKSKLAPKKWLLYKCNSIPRTSRSWQPQRNHFIVNYHIYIYTTIIFM